MTFREFLEVLLRCGECFPVFEEYLVPRVESIPSVCGWLLPFHFAVPDLPAVAV